MPTYTFRCNTCLNTEDHYRKVDQRNDAPLCHGNRMWRVITAPMVFVSPDICYDSPIDGRPITSMKARLEDLARSNCSPYDPEIKTDYQRRIKEKDAALDKSVDEIVDREIALMPAKKREKLVAELEGGLTVEPQRLTATAPPMKAELHNGRRT